MTADFNTTQYDADEWELLICAYQDSAWNACGKFVIYNENQTTHNLKARQGATVKFPVLTASGHIKEGIAVIPSYAFSHDVKITVGQEFSLAQERSQVAKLSHTNLGIKFTAENKQPQKTITLKVPYGDKDVEGID